MVQRYSTIENFNIENLVIVRNITFGIASVGGSPGEFDILICLRTTPWEFNSTKPQKGVNSPNNSANYFNCKVLAVIEVNLLVSFSLFFISFILFY